ncbi:hypothetical protein E2C01_019508 [Portunus trituberculatus]|uniref:Uncharacterized protein n=1 Tax=Portunus trituberculatus TaxID=210409 RepID=A0A5B7DZK7_PORTR|nr:hypothetical protein [Portunus trituberculatus]
MIIRRINPYTGPHSRPPPAPLDPVALRYVISAPRLSPNFVALHYHAVSIIILPRIEQGGRSFVDRVQRPRWSRFVRLSGTESFSPEVTHGPEKCGASVTFWNVCWQSFRITAVEAKCYAAAA